jgi:hypothetical protein
MGILVRITDLVAYVANRQCRYVALDVEARLMQVLTDKARRRDLDLSSDLRVENRLHKPLMPRSFTYSRNTKSNRINGQNDILSSNDYQERLWDA